MQPEASILAKYESILSKYKRILSKYKSALSKYKSIRSKYYQRTKVYFQRTKIYFQNKKVYFQTRYKSINSKYKSTLSKYKSILSKYKSILSKYKSIPLRYKSILPEHKNILSKYTTILSMVYFQLTKYAIIAFKVQKCPFKVESNFRNRGNGIVGTRNLLNTSGFRNPVPRTSSVQGTEPANFFTIRAQGLRFTYPNQLALQCETQFSFDRTGKFHTRDSGIESVIF